MKTTILGGFLFLVPLAFIAIVLGKTYQISMMVAGPLDKIIPVSSIAGIAFVNILAIVLLLLVCFLAGLVARGGWFTGRIEKLDGFLIDVMPGYAVAKGMIGGVTKEDDIAAVMVPVMVRFDDYDQIAFEIERDDTQSVIFLPGAPSAWSGSTVVVDIARVRLLNIPVHQAVKLMRVLGRGSLAVKPAPVSQT
ncbi:hypothetical protein [Falsiphaeobacter marinintestinus]|uniref:hypothetical protein n=1 Tax=Falsiphaeobacter marinintestinus TaxID=1492905 RepID=UPI0011B80D4F|nr:hypothetical protein [Phaeobacter marinintestinus]